MDALKEGGKSFLGLLRKGFSSLVCSEKEKKGRLGGIRSVVSAGKEKRMERKKKDLN